LLNASPGDLLPAGRGFKLAMAGGLGVLAVVLSGITIAEDAKPAGRATVQEKTQENEEDEVVWEPPAAEIPLPPAPALRGDANRFSKLNFAVVYSNHDITGGQLVIPASEYEAFRSKIYSDPSNVVAAAFPAIAIRENGEEGRMEFIREVVRPKQKEAGKKILGWQINPAVLRENDRITLTMKATYGYAAGHAFGTPDPQQIRWPDPLDAIASASGESSAVVGPDDILVTSLGMLEKDCYVTVFTRALEIDATGRPITASPLPPEQELTEKVRLTGEISTFPLSKHQKAYLAEVKGLLLQPSESMDRAVLLADSRDGDLPAGVPFHPSGQPCIAAIIPPSSWKPFSGATGAKEALGPVEVVSGKRLKPWKQLDLELTVRLQRTFLGDELTLQLRPETFDVKWPGVPGQVWVIELKPLKAGTRRLLTLTAEKAQ
ncbi:MAG: hypothetical protein JWO82_2082, partial [Akkermansiaceae bacterium]|nr:hypothetical protein [Akkermansiaceae bacterium]